MKVIFGMGVFAPSFPLLSIPVYSVPCAMPPAQDARTIAHAELHPWYTTGFE